MICVYCVSHAPALLTLEIPGFEGQNGKLLFYFVLVVQASDVLQDTSGKLLGKHKIAPTVSPNKTWEGFLVAWPRQRCSGPPFGGRRLSRRGRLRARRWPLR